MTARSRPADPPILLVEDKDSLRAMLRHALEAQGHSVVEARDHNPDQELLTWLETYEEGIRKFRDRDFTQAKILFSRFLEFYPEDCLAKMYLERSLEYEQAPPDKAWNAVEVFERK